MNKMLQRLIRSLDRRVRWGGGVDGRVRGGGGSMDV